MKIVVEMSPEEWVHEREMLRAHLDELLNSEPALAKSGAGAVKTLQKPHPAKAIFEMTESLKDAYAGMLDELTDDVVSFMHAQIGQEPN